MVRHWMANRLMNQWVLHRGHGGGLGLCTAVYETSADIAYYTVAGEAPEVENLPVSEIRLPNSYTGYRAWVPKENFGFWPALIERHDGRGFVLHTPSGSRRVSPLDVVIRRSEPFTRPLAAVRTGATDDPALYLARRDFLAELALQATACRGYDSVPSAAIDLYDHQLETLQRVLEDPVPRFVLADEVGLGKTIEAALIVRQTLLDDDSAQVYISTPSTLVRQWRSELASKFLLGNMLESDDQLYPRILIRSHQEFATHPGEAQKARFLVIDEAHQLISDALWAGQWQTLARAAHAAHGLLLLSATPMRGNYGVLEALLHLVDPGAFPLGQAERFAERVEERTAELVDVDVLMSRFSMPTDRTEALKRIRDRHPGDPFVEQATDPNASGVADSTAQLEHYLRETFRISRRMIRHRRGVGAAAAFPTAGRRAFLILVQDDQAQEVIDDFLETYRLRVQALPRTLAVPLFWKAVSHGLAGTGPLREFITARLAELARPESLGDTAGEWSLLEQVRARLVLTPDARVRVAVEEACRRVEAGQRIVAISGYAVEARRFADMAQDRLGESCKVLTHLADTATVTGEWMLESFLTADGGGLLVGDSSLEEGRNLQGSDGLLNLDLPLSPNRLEQRIGRVDRYVGVSTLPAARVVPEILVLLPTKSLWSSAQVRLFDEGVGIFTDSVSTVQRLLAKMEADLSTRLLDEGVAALSAGLSELRDAIKDEKIQVDELEDWESDSAFDDGNAVTTELLRTYEDRAAELTPALSALMSSAGGLPLEVEGARESETFRFRLRRHPAYLVPPDLNPRMEELLGHDYSIQRRASLTHALVTPLRVGDPLVGWLRDYLLADERGRAFALTVDDESVFTWDLWLRLDYLIEFSEHSLAQVPVHERRRLRRRGQGFLAPRMFGLWANADFVANPGLTQHLDSLLEARSGTSGLTVNWLEVLAEIQGWATECSAAERTGRAWVAASEEVRFAVASGVDAAGRDVSRREGVLSARAARLPSLGERTAARNDLERERILGRSILQGVAEPSISLVSCGALIRRPA
jgi:ATP-dependent helicase HepA